MLYIFGKSIPVEKKIIYSLTHFFGINLFYSKKICKNMGINPSVRINSLKKSKIRKLIQYIDQNVIIEQNLKKNLVLKKKKLVEIKSYRGLRNLQGLPVHGQRTHTNKKTSKKLKNKI
jgi:small subunit ribosomal protein S13